jgi:threonine aldolase
MGSILAGSHDDIQRARRARKLFGGALRQAGIPAAACAYALDHNINRLAEDHANASLFAQKIAEVPGIHVDPTGVETNLVFFEIDPSFGTAAQLSAALLKRGIKLNPAGGTHRLRACTHLDVDRDGVLRAATAIRDCLTEGLEARPPRAANGAYATR